MTLFINFSQFLQQNVQYRSFEERVRATNGLCLVVNSVTLKVCVRQII